MIWVGLECSPPQPRLTWIFGAIAWIGFLYVSSSRLPFIFYFFFPPMSFIRHFHSETPALANVAGPGADWCKPVVFNSKPSGTQSAFLLSACWGAQHDGPGLNCMPSEQLSFSCCPPSWCCGPWYWGMAEGSAAHKASRGKFLWEGSGLENGLSKLVGELTL